MLWIYFITGIRVNEGCALQWYDIDFEKKRLRVHHMLIIKNKKIGLVILIQKLKMANV